MKKGTRSKKVGRREKPEKLGAQVRPEDCWVEWLPVYRKPFWAARPYDAYIQIDTQTGISYPVTRYHAEEVRWELKRGYVRWVPIAPNTLGHALDSLLWSRQFKALKERVKNGAEEFQVGYETHVQLNADAKAALEEIAQLAKRLPTAIIHDDPMDAIPGLYEQTAEGLHVIEGRVLAFEWIKEAFGLYHECWFEDAAWHCAPGLHERMWDMAEENEKRLKGE